MSSVLHVLAESYAASAAGRAGGVRDYLIDHEELLRLAGARDGDARELAIAGLARAERESAGLLVIERHVKSGIPGNVRLAKEGGEAWLFRRLGLPSPEAARIALAEFFIAASERLVPDSYMEQWREWLSGLADAARSGGGIDPFRRGDDSGNLDLMDALAGVLNWRGDSLLPYASAVICGDSKRLKSLEGRLRRAIPSITGDEVGLERFGIFEKPREVWFHGPLECVFRDGTRCDFSRMPGAVGFSEVNLDVVESVRVAAPLCLTVENEAVFLELVKRNPGVFLIRAGFAGSAVMKLLAMLPRDTRIMHFGDTDAAGFDILRDLRERGGRAFAPLLMEPDSTPGTPALNAREIQTLDRLINSPSMLDIRERLIRYRDAGVKGRFEQELVPVDRVIEELILLGRPLGRQEREGMGDGG